MSQTLPDLVVSPCPVREPWLTFLLRSHVAMALNDGDEGFSWHHAGCMNEGVVVYWKTYLQFDGDAPAGVLRFCQHFPLCDREGSLLDEGWLQQRLSQIPASGSRGRFDALAEEAIFKVDVRDCENGAYFRFVDRPSSKVDLKKVLGFQWAPEGMEVARTFDDEGIVHFQTIQEPRFDGTLASLFFRFRGSSRDKRREEETTSSTN